MVVDIETKDIEISFLRDTLGPIKTDILTEIHEDSDIRE